MKQPRLVAFYNFLSDVVWFDTLRTEDLKVDHLDFFLDPVRFLLSTELAVARDNREVVTAAVCVVCECSGITGKSDRVVVDHVAVYFACFDHSVCYDDSPLGIEGSGEITFTRLSVDNGELARSLKSGDYVLCRPGLAVYSVEYCACDKNFVRDIIIAVGTFAFNDSCEKFEIFSGKTTGICFDLCRKIIALRIGSILPHSLIASLAFCFGLILHCGIYRFGCQE